MRERKARDRMISTTTVATWELEVAGELVESDIESPWLSADLPPEIKYSNNLLKYHTDRFPIQVVIQS